MWDVAGEARAWARAQARNSRSNWWVWLQLRSPGYSSWFSLAVRLLQLEASSTPVDHAGAP